MSDTLADLLAKKFIARRDVKAIQLALSDGKVVYQPHVTGPKSNPQRLPWKRQDLNDHITGVKTYGHYLLSKDSKTKLFAFDIDLEKTGAWPEWAEGDNEDDIPTIHEFNPREAWLQRSHPARPWMKYQFKSLANKFMKAIYEELELPCAAAYSGGKGIHVYAFTGLIDAQEAREGAQIVLDTIGEFEPLRGQHFFQHREKNAVTGFPNVSVEVYPKQDSLESKDLGNLMRLPLGRNLRSKDPTFFIDMTSAHGQMIPVDPVFALTTDDPWKRPDE